MARGKQRGRGQKRKHGHGRHEKLNKKQRSHLKQFGESHPIDDSENSRHKFKKFEDKREEKSQSPVEESSGSESEDEAPTAYQQLLSTFSNSSSKYSDTDEKGEDDDDISDESDDVASASRDTASGLLEDEGEEDEDEDEPSEGDEDEQEDNESETHKDTSSVLSDDDVDDDDDDDYIDQEVEDGEDDDEHSLKKDDPFTKHFEVDIPDSLVEELPNSSSWQKQSTQVPGLGPCTVTRPKVAQETPHQNMKGDLKKLHVKKVLCNQVVATNKKYTKADLKENEMLSPLQQALFSVMNNYQDLCFMNRNLDNGEEIRLAYCFHALNHVLKTRSRIIAHNAKVKSKKDGNLDDHRDQGLTRPKVLIVLPFRDSALKVVQILNRLLMANDQNFTSNKKRFQKEFSLLEEDNTGNKPEDYEATFCGNIDDHFRVGLAVAKKTLKLYTPFYLSDIILASPLGLRTVIGAEGEKERDYDFLSSIEILIFDQMDIFLMQNWDHIMHIMEHLNLQPKESHDVDFSRVRMWTLNGWSKYYRQTLMFGDVVLPEINAIFNKQCHNYAGKCQATKKYSAGSICHIVVPLPQVFHRIAVGKYSDAPEARFDFFKSKILPEYKDKAMSHTLIFIPSYFDFVRIRNFFRKEEVSFQKLCEYTVDKSISRARSFFYHGRAHFLLFTERLHFYRRFRIRGIKHIIFYDLPTYSNFYSEVANMLIDNKHKQATSEHYTCEVLYTKYDVHKLSAVVGSERAAQMVHSDKSTHMLMTGDT